MASEVESWQFSLFHQQCPASYAHNNGLKQAPMVCLLTFAFYFSSTLVFNSAKKKLYFPTPTSIINFKWQCCKIIYIYIYIYIELPWSTKQILFNFHFFISSIRLAMPIIIGLKQVLVVCWLTFTMVFNSAPKKIMVINHIKRVNVSTVPYWFIEPLCHFFFFFFFFKF